MTEVQISEVQVSEVHEREGVREEGEVQPMVVVRRASAAVVTQAEPELEAAVVAASTRKALCIGEAVHGKILQLNAQMALLALEEPHLEAMIELSELHDEEGILRLGIGDELDAYVVEMGAKGIVLSRQLPEKFQHLAELKKAQEMRRPVEGLVLAAKKGGIEVAIEQTRAFCPSSQVELGTPKSLESFIGEKLLFHIMKVKGQRVLLSRRALLEEAMQDKIAVLRSELSEGKILKGVVTHLRDFGAFVDIGGLEGLVPLLELSHRRIHHPSEVLYAGEEVEVKILRIEPPSPPERTKERITLSVKQCQEEPWRQAAAQLRVGTEYKGKVVRLAPFGAFVELFPGVDGLLHISELGAKRVTHPKEVLSIGQELQVVLDAFSMEEHRASLRIPRRADIREFPAFDSLTQEQEKPAPLPVEPEAKHVVVRKEPRGGERGEPRERGERGEPRGGPRLRMGDLVMVKIERIEPSGLFVVLGQRPGFIPGNETATARGTDLKRVFQLGQEVQAEVLGVSAEEVRLSIAKAQKTEERKTLETFRQQQKASVGFGTLADKLKNLKVQ
ncbi:MAG: S1 RNA-binding domain-containing protein [Cystobacterineae bacterium]|nr:S1 RNA-binding domain-containing protein [Cystobacterineae bacterium]